MLYTNNSKRIKSRWSGSPLSNEEYQYDKPSQYLYMWGGLLQRVAVIDISFLVEFDVI